MKFQMDMEKLRRKFHRSIPTYDICMSLSYFLDVEFFAFLAPSRTHLFHLLNLQYNLKPHAGQFVQHVSTISVFTELFTFLR